MARPKNPYAERGWGAVPADVDAWLTANLRTKPRGTRPDDAFFAELPEAISEILAADLPRPMRYIEALLTFTYGVRPDDVNAAIAAAPNVIRTPTQIENDPKPAVILSVGKKPTQTERNTLQRMYVKFRRSIDNRRVGKTAELYVHGLLTQSGAYRKMLRSQVGEFRDPTGKHKFDLVVVDSETTQRFGISIKNLRSFIYENHPAFADLQKMAVAHDVTPWLIASFMLPEAKAHATRLGIRWHELGAQIMPLTMPDPEDRRTLRDTRVVVERARHIIGPVPVRFVPLNRFPPRAKWRDDPTSGIGLDAWTIPDGPVDDMSAIAFFEKLADGQR